MQVAPEQTARSVFDRAVALAGQRGSRATTLHLASAWIEHDELGAEWFLARGLRSEDLRTAVKVYEEIAGVFERVQSAAKKLAHERGAGEPRGVHLVAAALREPASALYAALANLGHAPARLAEDVLALRARPAIVQKPVAHPRGASHAVRGATTHAVPQTAPARGAHASPSPVPPSSSPVGNSGRGSVAPSARGGAILHSGMRGSSVESPAKVAAPASTEPVVSRAGRHVNGVRDQGVILTSSGPVACEDATRLAQEARTANTVSSTTPAMAPNGRGSKSPSSVVPQGPVRSSSSGTGAAPRSPSPSQERARSASALPIPPSPPVPSATRSSPPSALGSTPPTGLPMPGAPTSRARTSPSLPPSTRPQKHERTAHDLDPRTFPALALCARNLSADGARGALDPAVGRAKEVQRVLDAVGRREGRGCLLVGPPGVGKSTLLRAVAREPGAPAVLLLRHAEVAAQARGAQGAERAKRLVEELLRAADRVVVALDPIAPWFLTRDLPDELVLELRAALAGGKLAWVGAATAEESRKLVEAEPWIDRATLRVDVEEPGGTALRDVVRAYAPAIATHHNVLAEPAVLDLAADLSERYLGGRAQPDRALGVIDLALSRARRAKLSVLPRELVAGVVSELGAVPFERVASTDHERLLGMEQWLGQRVVGHGHALARIAQTLRRNAVGFRGNRPIGTFLFLGPTGVGKTEAAKAIADALFPGAGAMTRFDMAEFSEAHAVARLVGAPPGYVGHSDGGQLTESVRRKPYQLVLFDEIEKAHRDVLEALLALLDEGRMTDGRGRTVDFKNTVVVLTSNLGAEVFDPARDGRGPVKHERTRRIGFVHDEPTPAPGQDPVNAALAQSALETARAALPPELWNRIDEPVVFGALTRDEVRKIAARMLAGTFARLEAEQGVVAEPTHELVEFLLDHGGYEPTLGARPMRRAIARIVEAPIADAVLRGTLARGARAKLTVRDWGVEVGRAEAEREASSMSASA